MLDGAELRALIRDVIAAELAAAKGSPRPTPSAAGTGASPVPVEQRVRIANDADLAAFAKQVLVLAADPKVQRRIAAGAYGFKLDGAPTFTPVQAGASSSAGSARIDQGVVTETVLSKLPRGTGRLQIGAGVSVTPLARDRARNLGITIERMKP
jgi:hypothetical protein